MHKNKLSIGFLVLSLAAFGCGDDDDGGPDAGSPDASAIDGGTGIDASTIDGGTTVAPGPCSITYLQEYFNYTPDPTPVPFVGAGVIFNRPDGTFIDSKLTDADGVAGIANCVENTMITVTPPAVLTSYPVGEFGLITIAGVQPGNNIHLGDPWGYNLPSFAKLAVDISFDQNLGAFDPLPDNFDVLAGDQRYSQFPGVSAVVSKGIENVFLGLANSNRSYADTTSVLARARIESDTVGFAYRKNVALSGVTPVALPAFQPAGSFTRTLRNNLSDSYVYWQLMWSVGELVITGRYEGLEMNPGDVDTDTVPMPVGFADRLISRTFENDCESDFYQATTRWLAGSANTVDIDVSGSTLPRITDAIMGLANPAQPVVSFATTGGTLGDVTGVIGKLAWTSPVPKLPPEQHTWWLLMAPGADNTFHFPALPETFAHLAPKATSSFQQPQLVATFDADWGTVGDVLAAPFSFFLLDNADRWFWDSYRLWPEAPSTGRLRVMAPQCAE